MVTKHQPMCGHLELLHSSWPKVHHRTTVWVRCRSLLKRCKKIHREFGARMVFQIVYFVGSTSKGIDVQRWCFFPSSNFFFLFFRSLKTYGKSVSSTTEWAHNSSQFKKLVAKCLKRNADARETARSERRFSGLFLLVFLSPNPLTFFSLVFLLASCIFLVRPVNC